MKFIENQNTWETCISALNELDLSSMHIHQKSSDILNKSDHKKITDAIANMAKYSAKEDGTFEKVSSAQLWKMEEKGEIVGSHIFFRMARHYWLQEKLTMEDYSKERILCATIYSYIGNVYYFPVQKNVFKSVFELGMKLVEIREYDIFCDDFLKEIEKSIHIIQKYGIELSATNGCIDWNDEVNKSIFEILERKVIYIGGLTLFDYLWRKYFEDSYFPLLDRFMISREPEKKQSIPLQLLISLGMKHLSLDSSKFGKRDEDSKGILDLAKAWYNVLEIEGESASEYAMCTVEQYPLMLMNQMLVDKFCIPKQYSQRYILVSLEHLVKPFFDQCDKKYSYTDYINVVNYLMDIPSSFAVINVNQMKKCLRVANYKIDLILNDISIPLRMVNSNFDGIDSSCNHYKWPIIRFPMGQYVYINSHICGFGFYNAAYEMVKKKNPTIDRDQGVYVEEIIKEELHKKGYSYVCGKYQGIKKKKLSGSDCDLIMQNKGTYFFELKKTSVTNELENIDDITLLKQLSKGMVKAQKQCFSHELYLKKNGSIVLDNKGENYTLLPASNEDPCYKISVCHQEYSFLTSKHFYTLLLEAILCGEINTRDPGRENDLDELNKIGQQMQKMIFSKNGNRKAIARDETFFSVFCSLQQLLMALWNSTSEADFLDMVKEWIYYQDKSLDLYLQIFMHIYYRENPDQFNLKKKALEMFERTGKKSMFIMG